MKTKQLNGYKIEFYSENKWFTLVKNTTDSFGLTVEQWGIVRNSLKIASGYGK